MLGDETRFVPSVRVIKLGGYWRGCGVGGHITYIPGRVYRALDKSLIHESHVNGTEKVAS